MLFPNEQPYAVRVGVTLEALMEGQTYEYCLNTRPSRHAIDLPYGTEFKMEHLPLCFIPTGVYEMLFNVHFSNSAQCSLFYEGYFWFIIVWNRLIMLLKSFSAIRCKKASLLADAYEYI